MKKSNLFKRFVSLVLALVMMLGSLYIAPSSVSAATVKFSKSSLLMVVKHSCNLKLNGTSSKITWKSSNNSVVSFTKVSNNHIKVKAKKTGAAYISAKVGSKTYKCDVKVVKTDFDNCQKTMFAGNTYQLNVIGAKARKFESKNTSIASVSSTGKITAKKKGSTKILAYIGNSVATFLVDVEKSEGSTSRDNILLANGQHKTFDGLHLGDRVGYEEYCLTGNAETAFRNTMTVPVYKGKLVDVRNKDLFVKALRADKVVGNFYRNYIKPGMDDLERLQAVFRFLDSRPSYLVGWKGIDCWITKKEKAVVDTVPTKITTGCEHCQDQVMKGSTMGFGFGPSGPLANTAYAALYFKTATNRGWAEAFEFLCVAAGLDAFFCNYGGIDYPVRVKLFGYWVDMSPNGYRSGKKANKFFDFSNNGDKFHENRVWVNAGVADYRNRLLDFRCQYNVIKSYNRYSSRKITYYIPKGMSPEDYYLECRFFSEKKYKEYLGYAERGDCTILYKDPSKNLIMYHGNW